jgi:hypothetical protein
MQDGPRSEPRHRQRARWLGWWYVCIGLGFGLLGLRNFLAGGRAWGIVLRCVIAIGFVLLGAGSLRSSDASSREAGSRGN